MDTNSAVKGSIVVCSILLVTACASTGQESSGMRMTFGNSENVQVIENPVMMFHEIIVSPTADGAELVGKMHVRRETRYVPGHIDIAVVDKVTEEVKLIVSTDFNPRIAEYGHRNLNHPNNLGVDLPGVDPEKVTVYIAYHPSNLDRQSRFDCGNNIALVELQDKQKSN
jgi:hypothetical protein